MLPGSQTKVNVSVGTALCLMGGGIYLREEQGAVFPGLGMMVCGWVLFMAGCMWYAEGKGHAPGWGLLGMLSLLGLLILVMFKDRYPDGRSPRERFDRDEDDRDEDDRRPTRRRPPPGSSGLPWREQDDDRRPRDDDPDDEPPSRGSKPWERGRS